MSRGQSHMSQAKACGSITHVPGEGMLAVSSTRLENLKWKMGLGSTKAKEHEEKDEHQRKNERPTMNQAAMIMILKLILMAATVSATKGEKDGWWNNEWIMIAAYTTFVMMISLPSTPVQEGARLRKFKKKEHMNKEGEEIQEVPRPAGLPMPTQPPVPQGTTHPTQPPVSLAPTQP